MHAAGFERVLKVLSLIRNLGDIVDCCGTISGCLLVVSEFFVVAQGRLAKNNRRFDNGEIDFLLGDVPQLAQLHGSCLISSFLGENSAMYFCFFTAILPYAYTLHYLH